VPSTRRAENLFGRCAQNVEERSGAFRKGIGIDAKIQVQGGPFSAMQDDGRPPTRTISSFTEAVRNVVDCLKVSSIDFIFRTFSALP